MLLVEDEQAVGDALIDCLEQLGCRVIAKPDLNSATASACNESEDFDLAILDLELPDGNGLDLVQHLRARSNPCVALILTGHDEVEWARRAAAVGVAGFMRKPVSARRLSSEVAKALERSREMRAWLEPGEGEEQASEDEAEVVADALVVDLEPGVGRPTRTPREQVDILAREFGLTDRQAEALALVGSGLRDRQIAEAMDVSYSRVRQLLAAGFGKLGVKSRNDFIRFLCERQRT